MFSDLFPRNSLKGLKRGHLKGLYFVLLKDISEDEEIILSNFLSMKDFPKINFFNGNNRMGQTFFVSDDFLNTQKRKKKLGMDYLDLEEAIGFLTDEGILKEISFEEFAGIPLEP